MSQKHQLTDADRARILDLQMRSRPLKNDAVAIARGDDGKLLLSIPLAHRGWSNALRLVLPLRDQKKLELDQIGAEIFDLCDGARTIEQIIDIHKDRWQLSFFESRAMIFQFIKRLMRYNLIILIAPRRK